MIGVGFFLPLCIQSQQIQPLLTTAQMLQDLDTLASRIQASHPYPTGYAKVEEWQAAMQIAKDSCAKGERDVIEFSLIVGRLLRTMQDSHTQVHVPSLWNQHLNQTRRIIAFKTTGNRVSKDPLHLIPLGAELLTLDGHPFEEIVSKFQPWLIQEKNSLDGMSRIQDQMFPVYFSILYLQQQNHIVIHYKDLLGQEQSIDYPTWGTKEKEKYQRQNKALYEELPKTEFRTDTAYLSIASFAPDKMAKQNRVIHRFFKQCEKKEIGQLIIDLRDNTGGKSTEVEYVMSYLLKDGYNAPHNIIVKRSELSDGRVPWLKHWVVRKMLRLFFRKNEDIQRYVDLMELKHGEVDTLYFNNNMKQKRWIYTGQTHLWVNGMSASAAVNFTQAFQQNQLGTIWGQCIMGNDQGTFGNAAPTQLPHSKITVSIATIRYNYGPDFQFDHPNICPDKRIEYSIENIIHGTDPYWFAIRKKI